MNEAEAAIKMMGFNEPNKDRPGRQPEEGAPLQPPQQPQPVFALGTRVRHRERGLGSVTEMMDDGRTRVAFDNGEEHRYKPASLHKLFAVAEEGADDGGRPAPPSAADRLAMANGAASQRSSSRRWRDDTACRV